MITWSTDVAGGAIGRIVNDDGRDLLVQLDLDCPGIASTFGWSVRSVQRRTKGKCRHDSTDGTVRCEECGLDASDFISAACEWLADNDGETAEDPGYFDEERENPREDEPAPDDWITGDHRVFRDVERGKVQCTVGEDEDMWAVLGACMERQGFFPNVFFVSDHGNVHQLVPELPKKKYRRMGTRKKNPRRLHAITYGTMPNLHEFVNLSAADEDGESNYPYGMKLNSGDEGVANKAARKARVRIESGGTHVRGYTHVVDDAEDMWKFLNALKDGNNRAQDLASGIMSTLGYEWI